MLFDEPSEPDTHVNAPVIPMGVPLMRSEAGLAPFEGKARTFVVQPRDKLNNILRHVIDRFSCMNSELLESIGEKAL
jgi:hypothetical protein